MKRAALFSLGLIALPLLAIGGAIAVARSGWFLQHGLPAYMRGLESEWNIQGRQCDVVVFGDSSALTGIEPRRMSQQTGLRVCSVAQTKGTTGVTGTTFLDGYLRRNPPPRILLLAFAPEDWHAAASWSEVAYVEGVTQLVRHYPARYVARQLLTHPDATFGYATFVYKQTLAALLHRGAADDSADPSREEGHMTLPLPAETDCVANGGTRFAPDPAYIAALRATYTTPATHVLLAVPPVPQCDTARDYYLQRLQPYVDVTFPPLPVGDYNDLDRHFTREGSAQYSTWLSHKLASMGGGQP